MQDNGALSTALEKQMKRKRERERERERERKAISLGIFSWRTPR